MSYFKFFVIVCIILFMQSCGMRRGNDSITPRSYHHAEIICEYFSTMRDYAEHEDALIEDKERHLSRGLVFNVTSDSILSVFSARVDSILNDSHQIEEYWIKDIYVVALFEGCNVNDTIAIGRYKNQGVYINGACYGDSTLYNSVKDLLDPEITCPF